MDMTEWAEREIKIACARERNNNVDDGEWDYGCACYESALKAFKSLMGDGHSGFSIGITKHVLNRLIDGRPLTPIEDTPEVWIEEPWDSPYDDRVTYQCNRMSSLFKDVYVDGTVKYEDVDRVRCVNINYPSISYRSSLVRGLIDDMFPITMPYFPDGPINVYCEDFLTDRKNGDFDTVGIFYAVKPDGERVEINRFYKDGNADMEEITREEYDDRKRMAIKRELDD